MKKVISLLLVLVMCLSLCACGKSEAVKKISLSAAVGAVGVLGQKGCEKLLVKSEKMTKKAESKKRDRNIRSWQGKSCEDMI